MFMLVVFFMHSHKHGFVLSDLMLPFAFQGVLFHGGGKRQHTCNNDGSRERHVESFLIFF